MDDILSTKRLGRGRSLHIASLSRQTIIDSDAEHLGFDGFFVFEAFDLPNQKGLNILGKVASFDAGVQLANLLAGLFPHESKHDRTRRNHKRVKQQVPA